MRITRKVFSIYSESDLINEISERAFCEGYLAAEEEEKLFAAIRDQKKQANKIAKLEKELLKAQSEGQKAKIQAELDAARKRYKMEVDKASGSTSKLLRKEEELGSLVKNSDVSENKVSRAVSDYHKSMRKGAPEIGKSLKTLNNTKSTVNSAYLRAYAGDLKTRRSKQAKKDSRTSGVNKSISNVIHDNKKYNAVNRALEEESKIAAEKAARQEALQPQIQHQLEKEKIAAEELKKQQFIKESAAKKADSVLGSLIPKQPYSDIQAPLADPRQTEVLKWNNRRAAQEEVGRQLQAQQEAAAKAQQEAIAKAQQEAAAKAQQEAIAKAQQEAAALKSQEEKAGKSILGKAKELATSRAGKIGLGAAGAAGLGYGIYKYNHRNNN